MFGLFKKPKNLTDTHAAVECFRKKEYDQALTRANAIIDDAPTVALSHRFKGEVLFEMRRYPECIASFAEAERIGGPGTEECFFWRALAYANAGDKKQAVEILSAYITSNGASGEIVQKAKAALAAFSNGI